MYRVNDFLIILLAAVLFWSYICVREGRAEEPSQTRGPLRILQAESSQEEPPLYMAYYTRPTGLEMIGPTVPSIVVSNRMMGKHVRLSKDNGKSWELLEPQPNLVANLPHGYRRKFLPGVVDPNSGRLVNVYSALDTPGIEPGVAEPEIAQRSYYLRYNVSQDSGRTYLFDEPVVQAGMTEEHPFENVWKGKNAIYFGDIGTLPIFTRQGTLLTPAQYRPLDEKGEFYNPTRGHTYTNVIVLIGTWTDDHRIRWETSETIVGDPKRSTRGMIEPTLAELPDGRILMVLRGSNDTNRSFPSYKWRCVSSDGGKTWTEPEPFTYDSGKPFFSPSSMSRLITHSSGRVFWIGNINPTNSRGNNDRWPLVMGEVDTKTLQLIESSVITLDTRRDDDPALVHLAHAWAIEDRQTNDIRLIVPRALDGYKRFTWTSYRIGLE